MKIQLVRHATLWVEYAGVSFLVDPMFSEAGANPPIVNTANPVRNPLVPMPGPLDPWLAPDAVIVTHLHADHWDRAAAGTLSKTLPLYCQPGDQETIAKDGFTQVTEVNTSVTIQGITLTRTTGQHGTGEIGQMMGNVSGFIFQAPGEPVLYIAGDTVWCDDVRQALDTFNPDIAIVNAGGARFLTGDPITMDADDVAAICRYAPNTEIVAVHMDAINHCHITRDILRDNLQAAELLGQVALPQDGEQLVR
ncbi:MBL fold metallo-hydrolase [Paenibacillus kobensis]|uniref:MBL fold metallo-hydrolase n=1 Tax=Paenibacillus kobensis TaxID=59841 RepID=UPI000FD7E09E|nr:MBL fold metallo-hydrolase [Paenibacillus kobensis]